MKFLDKWRSLLGKKIVPKIKKGQRWRYLEDGITRVPVEENEKPKRGVSL